jgi:phosphoribosylanthranilate isomerase
MKEGKLIKLKVCGMRDMENIISVAQLEPEYMGFIFFEKSPRYVGPNFTMPDFDKSVRKVGVFVNENYDLVMRHVEKYGLHYVQLHGGEPVALVKQLSAAGIGVFKVFPVDGNFDFNFTKPFAPYVDFFLFDTKGRYHGGNAFAFNWQLLEKYDQQIPFLLSGGIGPENVKEIAALEGMNLHALDINSGVEISPGLKDMQKVKKVVLELEKLNNMKINRI